MCKQQARIARKEASTHADTAALMCLADSEACAHACTHVIHLQRIHNEQRLASLSRSLTHRRALCWLAPPTLALIAVGVAAPAMRFTVEDRYKGSVSRTEHTLSVASIGVAVSQRVRGRVRGAPTAGEEEEEEEGKRGTGVC